MLVIAGLQASSTNTEHRRLLFSICNILNLEKEDQQGLKTGVKVAAEGAAGKFGLSISAAALVGEYSSNVVGLLLTPLTANAPLGPSSQSQNKRMSDVKAKTISAILYYFMKNNVPSTVPSTSSMQRPISDHPEDKMVTAPTPN